MTKILIVDDSLMVRRQVGNTLKGMGYEVLEAVDGQDALDQLANTPEVRMVVCDVNMPRMSGLEFLERFSALGMTVPVIMLTTEGEHELIQRAKTYGAKGWIIKPFKPEYLTATAKKWAPLPT